MTRQLWISVGLALLLGALAPFSVARADFEVAGPDGRRILLKDDGTWRYQEAVGDEKPAERPKVSGEGVLSLERRVEEGPNCRFGLRLANNTNYEIQNIVPYIAAYRDNSVMYDTRGIGFFSIKPGNSLYREVVFQGITCAEIARLQVTGGDRCVMGDLDRFSAEAGKCLERVRVMPSELVRFEK
jgi:hypothetical protein